MPGSGIAVNYLDAKRDLSAVEHTAGDVLSQSLQEVSSHIDTRGVGVPVVVFNSLSWPRKEVIEIETQLPEPAAGIEVADADGNMVPSQVLNWDHDTHRTRLLLHASVPAVGYAVFFVRGTEKSTAQPVELKSTPESLENEVVRVRVDPQTGCIISLFDKRSGKEALAPADTDTGGPKGRPCGNLLQAFADQPKEYDAWNIDADFESKLWNLDKADEVTLTESGPLRAVIRVKKHFQNSSFIQDITLYPGTARVDVNMQADWNEKHILLKVAFPVSVHARKATFEIPFGSIERPTTRLTPEERSQFEVPAEQWADLSDPMHGLSLLNDSKYGYDAKGNVLRLSLLRSPTWPDPHADEGHHAFTYSIYPHQGTWRDAETVRRGYELNYHLSWRQVQNHAGALPKLHSFVEVSSPNIVLTAIKTAESNDSMILRFYEWAGKESDVKLRVPPSARAAMETNLIEQQIGSLPIEHDMITVHTKPYEIKTVAVSFGASPN
jgi:alpha-mannosidase